MQQKGDDRPNDEANKAAESFDMSDGDEVLAADFLRSFPPAHSFTRRENLGNDDLEGPDVSGPATKLAASWAEEAMLAWVQSDLVSSSTSSIDTSLEAADHGGRSTRANESLSESVPGS